MKIILTITLLAANIFGQQSLDHYVKFGQENNADVQSAFYLWKASQDEISVAKKTAKSNVECWRFSGKCRNCSRTAGI